MTVHGCPLAVFAFDAGGVVAGAQIVEAGAGVGEQMPGDHQDRAAEGDDGAFGAAAAMRRYLSPRKVSVLAAPAAFPQDGGQVGVPAAGFAPTCWLGPTMPRTGFLSGALAVPDKQRWTSSAQHSLAADCTSAGCALPHQGRVVGCAGGRRWPLVRRQSATGSPPGDGGCPDQRVQRAHLAGRGRSRANRPTRPRPDAVWPGGKGKQGQDLGCVHRISFRSAWLPGQAAADDRCLLSRPGVLGAPVPGWTLRL